MLDEMGSGRVVRSGRCSASDVMLTLLALGTEFPVITPIACSAAVQYLMQMRCLYI